MTNNTNNARDFFSPPSSSAEKGRDEKKGGRPKGRKRKRIWVDDIGNCGFVRINFALYY
jgi:hypothetical protein